MQATNITAIRGYVIAFVVTLLMIMSLGPQIPRNPLELLGGEKIVESSLAVKYYAPTIGGVVGFVGVVVSNYLTRRPMMSGLQKHVFWTLGLGWFCKKMNDVKLRYMADRDAIYRHYIELHPEDFPDPEPKKFGEVFENWYPSR